MDLTFFQKPQVNLTRSTAGRMWLISVCAFLAVIQSSLSDSYTSLILALCAIAGTVVTEFFFNVKDRCYTLKDGSAVASALVLSLFLPNQLHPAYAFLGAVFAMAVIKHSFGGLGTNWANPALGAWRFIRVFWPGAFGKSLALSPLSRLSDILGGGGIDPQGSPLGILKINGWSGASFDTALTSTLNNTIFSLTGTPLPGGYLHFFVSPEPGIIADRGLLLLLLGTIVLTAAQCFRFWVPALFLCFYALLIRIFGALPLGGALGNGDILFAFFSGGTLAGAFLLVTEPATGPKSAPGTVVYVFLTALFAFIFRYPALEPYGICFAVLLGNTLVPLIRQCENRRFREKRGGP
jgi:electron transport complex protein RnfD